MTNNIDNDPPRLVGLCGDYTHQHVLAWLMSDNSAGRGYVEVSTRDLARDLVGSMHLDFAGVALDDLLSQESWTAVLADDTPAATLAGIAIERAHRTLSQTAPPHALDNEAVEQASTILVSGASVVITGVDTVELATQIRSLGGVVIRLDAPLAIHGTPIGAVVTPGMDLAIPMAGPGKLSTRQALAAIETCLSERTADASTRAA